MEEYDWSISRITVQDVARLLVLFDLDNTLVDRRVTLADWSAEFTARHGLADEERAHVLGMVAERAYPSIFEVIRARYRVPMSPEELWRTYCVDIVASVSCPDEILDGLDELRGAGWRVGVATNGAMDRTAKILKGLIIRRPWVGVPPAPPQ